MATYQLWHSPDKKRKHADGNFSRLGATEVCGIFPNSPLKGFVGIMKTATLVKKRRRLARRKVDATTDEQLLTRYRETSDRDVFARLVKRYERELFNYLCRYLGNAEMAEDVFQAAFLQVHLKCDQFQDDRRFRPWLYAIATNKAIDAQRRNKRHRATSLDQATRGDDDLGTLIDMLSSDAPDPADVVTSDESQQWIRNQIETLPEHLRTVIGLVYFQGLKYREAADALSIPVGTVKSRLHTAVLRMNEAWRADHIERN